MCVETGCAHSERRPGAVLHAGDRDRAVAGAGCALARVFKALADPVRLRLLSMIAGAEGGEACVCELTVGFDVSGPTISHHLKVLREAGLIEGDRRGTWIYYRARAAGVGGGVRGAAARAGVGVIGPGLPRPAAGPS